MGLRVSSGMGSLGSRLVSQMGLGRVKTLVGEVRTGEQRCREFPRLAYAVIAAISC